MNKSAYVVLRQPVVAMNSAAGEQIITGINPVTLGVSSRGMPLGRYLTELLDGVRVSHLIF